MQGGGAVAGLTTEETGQLAEARSAEAARRAAKQQADLQASSVSLCAASSTLLERLPRPPARVYGWGFKVQGVAICA